MAQCNDSTCNRSLAGTYPFNLNNGQQVKFKSFSYSSLSRFVIVFFFVLVFESRQSFKVFLLPDWFGLSFSLSLSLSSIFFFFLLIELFEKQTFFKNLQSTFAFCKKGKNPNCACYYFPGPHTCLHLDLSRTNKVITSLKSLCGTFYKPLFPQNR